MNLFKLPEINKEKILHFLPSKKFGFYFLIAVCIPLFAFILFSDNGVVTRVVALITGGRTRGEIAELQAKAVQDSDGDGLDDWQEALWRTDFKNPDTDGDGTKDGEEIALKRSPLVAGPNDSFAETLQAEQSLASPGAENLTEELSKNLLTKYITVKKVLGGNKVSAEEKEQITNSILAEMSSISAPAELYTANDIKTTQDNSAASIKKYGNAVGKIIINYASKINAINDMLVAKEAIETNSPEKMQELSKSVDAYNEIESSLLKISAPSSLKEKHLAILNAFYKNRKNTENAMLYFSDPMRSMMAISSQGEEIKNLLYSITALNESFASAGVTFKNNESGFFIQTTMGNLPK